jgi:uncharacterized protein DUF3617
MTRVWVWTGSVALAASMAAVLAAQVPALDVKYGLWEMTTATTIGGQMPQVDTSRMTPEQKAKIDEAMKQMMGTHNDVSKACITKEKVEKSVFMMGDEGKNCVQKITTNTRTTLDASVSCTGQQAMTGQMHIEALSPTSLRGTVKSSGAAAGSAMTATIAVTGKWLAADCGDVK